MCFLRPPSQIISLAHSPEVILCQARLLIPKTQVFLKLLTQLESNTMPPQWQANKTTPVGDRQLLLVPLAHFELLLQSEHFLAQGDRRHWSPDLHHLVSLDEPMGLWRQSVQCHGRCGAATGQTCNY